jgi:hypothetical protein
MSRQLRAVEALPGVAELGGMLDGGEVDYSSFP